MGRIGDFVKLVKTSLQKRKSANGQIKQPTIALLERQMPYINKPISDAKADEIGMDVYVDYLESAIEQGASMIAVVSRFGTGKSSLIELLKRKYHGWEMRKKAKSERVYCQVNLWSQLETVAGGPVKNGEEGQKDNYFANNTLELHRTFLYQLIAAIAPEKSSYFSRRTSRNFGMFRICTESPVWNVVVNVIAVVFFVGMLVQHFKDEIITFSSIEEATINLLIILLYVVCTIGIVLLILRTEIIFSSKNSEGNRQIEENELIDLYREHVLRQRNWWNKLWAYLFGTKHYVVVVEDLDRTDDGESVYRFLKELRKYYVPDEQLENTFLNRVTFVINIMPEDLLHERCYAKKNEYVYDKLFDYALHLNRINIDNFDAVLEALIQEKRSEIEALGIRVWDSDNLHQIQGMQWIVHGKELTLRQVKERLNDAILLYESLWKKFGTECADFEKCAAVAYLRNAFSKEFYKLPDRELALMLNWYTKDFGNEDEFVKAFAHEEEDKVKWSPEFLKEVHLLIRSHVIDGNFRTYFFNYPKDSYLYTIQESNVRNLIIYDEDMTDEMLEEIEEVARQRPRVIADAIDTVMELAKVVPRGVFFSEVLWTMARARYPKIMPEVLSAYLDGVEKGDKDTYEIIDNVIMFEEGAQTLCEVLLDMSTEAIVAARDYILEHFRERLALVIDLFHEPGCPVTEEEMEQMQNVPLEVVLQIVTPVLVNVEWEVAKMVCDRILASDTVSRPQEEAFYNALLDVYEVSDIEQELVKYMKSRQFLSEELETYIYNNVVEEEIKSERYFELLNAMPVSEVTEKHLERLSMLGEPGRVSAGICEKMKACQMYASYLMNMVLLDASKMDIAKEDVLTAFESKGQEIWESYPDVFKKLRQWMCEKYKDDVIAFQTYFKLPYPLITASEMRNIAELQVALQLYDPARVQEDEEGAFVEYCNRQFRGSTDALFIFEYIAQMNENVIPKIFYALDMKKVRFSLMGGPRKRKVVDLLRIPLELTTVEAILDFMDFTGALVEGLEKEIREDLKTAEAELCYEYFNVVEKYGKTTSETLKNIKVIPNLYDYGNTINEELYKSGDYKRYVSSKTQETRVFEIEYDKLDTLWPAYMEIMKSADGYKISRPCMYRSKDFLEMIQTRKAYKGFPKESRLAMAKVLQDEDNLEEILLNYSEECIVEYYCSITGFESKNAAHKFVSIMKRNQKYAQNKKIYTHVHGLLQDPNLKRTYTQLYKKANS